MGLYSSPAEAAPIEQELQPLNEVEGDSDTCRSDSRGSGIPAFCVDPQGKGCRVYDPDLPSFPERETPHSQPLRVRQERRVSEHRLSVVAVFVPEAESGPAQSGNSTTIYNYYCSYYEPSGCGLNERSHESRT